MPVRYAGEEVDVNGGPGIASWLSASLTMMVFVEVLPTKRDDVRYDVTLAFSIKAEHQPHGWSRVHLSATAEFLYPPEPGKDAGALGE